jgi:hypothetical protein
MTDQHRCCESVVPLEVAAKGIKTSTTLDTTTCSVSNAIQVLNDIRTYKTLNIEQLHQNEAEIKKIKILCTKQQGYFLYHLSCMGHISDLTS